jgi:hypothetical protein
MRLQNISYSVLRIPKVILLLIRLRIGTGGSVEHGNEPSGSIKCMEILG